MLLDRVNHSNWPKSFTDAFGRGRNYARRFSMSGMDVDHLTRMAEKLTDLIVEQAQFANPPFETTYLEMDMSQEAGEELTSGILVHEGMCFFFVNSPEQGRVIASRFVVDLKTGQAHDLGVNNASLRPVDIKTLRDSAVQSWAMILLFFMLLSTPRSHTITDRPATSKIIKGKRRAYAAHSVVTIDLSADLERRIKNEARRGPVRAHEVRGTWVNYAKVKTCQHDWEAMVPDFPGDNRERYICRCGQRRTWRKSHQRGDASLGYVTHEYLVTGVPA